MMLRCRTDTRRVVALLHDVVEDSPFTLEDLAAEGFPPHIIAGIDGMTRRTSESYKDFVDRAARNSLSFYVKRLDLEDNMNLLRLTDRADEEVARLQKYHAAHWHLLEHAGEDTW